MGKARGREVLPVQDTGSQDEGREEELTALAYVDVVSLEGDDSAPAATQQPASSSMQIVKDSLPLVIKPLMNQRPWQMVLAVVGVAVLVLCAIAAAWRGAAPQQAPSFAPACRGVGDCPVRSLFTNPKIQTVAVDNIMEVGSHLLAPEDRPLVEKMVADVLLNVSHSLQEQVPLVADKLDKLQLSDAEINGVLMSMHLLSDRRVQELGLEVGRAIRASPSPARDYLLSHIEAKLKPRAMEIKRLRSEVVPDSLLLLWAARHAPELASELVQTDAEEEEVSQKFELTLDAANIRSMEVVSGRFAAEFTPRETVDEKRKRLAIEGGALEESRVLLSLLRLCVRHRGLHHAAVSHQLHLGFAPLSWPCQMDGETDSKADMEKGLLCPLKFGAQGLDALKAAAV